MDKAATYSCRCKRSPLPPIVGDIAFAGGIVLLVVGKDKRKAYEEKLDAELKEWNTQIASLKDKAETTKAADTKINYYKSIEVLEHKKDQASTKPQELKTAFKAGDRLLSVQLNG